MKSVQFSLVQFLPRRASLLSNPSMSPAPSRTKVPQRLASNIGLVENRLLPNPEGGMLIPFAYRQTTPSPTKIVLGFTRVATEMRLACPILHKFPQRLASNTGLVKNKLFPNPEVCVQINYTITDKNSAGVYKSRYRDAETFDSACTILHKFPQRLASNIGLVENRLLPNPEGGMLVAFAYRQTAPSLTKIVLGFTRVATEMTQHLTWPAPYSTSFQKIGLKHWSG